MKELARFGRMLQWPAIFVTLALVTNDKWHASVIVLALVFRRDVSEVIRRRRLAVEMLGFKGCLDEPPNEPKKPARTSRRKVP